MLVFLMAECLEFDLSQSFILKLSLVWFLKDKHVLVSVPLHLCGNLQGIYVVDTVLQQ